MKTLLTIIIVLAMVGLVYGDSDLDNRKNGLLIVDIEGSDLPNTISKDDSTQYKVTISITYNAVSPERAKQIAGEIMTKHNDACNVVVNVSKTQRYQFLTSTDGTD